MSILMEDDGRRPRLYIIPPTATIGKAGDAIIIDTKDMDDTAFLLALAVAFLDDIRFFMTREHLVNFPDESAFAAIVDAIEEN